ncbi:DUF2865 domain-containing protein [Roseibium sediminis]|uniref:DUF2865 domain-containing protein n=1 Tax=Roseibium sediminis TaxID=1775174 RepID=UPI00123DECC7|nr:DUF2865 domain-containing protein [Roseibium sediminis]
MHSIGLHIPKMLKGLARYLMLPGLALVILTPDIADAATCAGLQKELNRLSSNSKSAEVAKWEEAWRRQDAAMTGAERDARYFQCDVQANSAKCRGLNSKIQKMRKNLGAIERQIQKAERGGGNVAAKVQQIRAQYARMKCGQSAAPAREASNSDNGFLQKLFSQNQKVVEPTTPKYRTLGNGIVVAVNSNPVITPAPEVSETALTVQRARLRLSNDGDEIRSKVEVGGGETYRTMCVRTCDGFYFPVSFSTRKKHFAEDSMRCAEMCPTARTELFAYPNPGGLPEDMTSMAGDPYVQMSNAYRFRKEVVEGCSCRSANMSLPRDRMAEIGQSGSARYAEIGTSGSAGSDDRSSGPLGALNPLAVNALPAEHIPARSDPATREDYKWGFNAAAPLPARRLVASASDSEGSGALGGSAKSLPVLGNVTLRTSTKATIPASDFSSPTTPDAKKPAEEIAPVFSSLDKKAPVIQTEKERASIRVVGPDYFVSQ